MSAAAAPLTVIDTFAGIGGFSLGLERTKFFETIAFVEIDDFAQRVLAKNWPGVPIYDDIKRFNYARARADGLVRRPDVITGGFPCTDISLAGNQAGIEGAESGLWSELRRVIGDFRPRVAVMENVSALLSGDRGRWFGRVLGDLAALGYIVEWHCIPASHVGAPHRRDRVWIIATDPDQGEVRIQQRGRPPGPCTSGAGDDGKPQPMADSDQVNADDRRHGTGPVCGQQPGATELSGGDEIVSDASGSEQGRRVESQRGPDQRDPDPAWDGEERRAAPDTDGDGSQRPGGRELREAQGSGQFREDLADADVRGWPSWCRDERSPEEAGREYWNHVKRCSGIMPDPFSERLERLLAGWTAAGSIDGPGDGGDTGWWSAEPDVGRVANGVPNRVDRLRCLGNAIVPTIAQLIGYSIAEREGLL